MAKQVDLNDFGKAHFTNLPAGLIPADVPGYVKFSDDGTATLEDGREIGAWTDVQMAGYNPPEPGTFLLFN